MTTSHPTDTTPDAPVVLDQSAGLLRFSTCGSVDDGKSTLIGRLLYDTKSIFEDQLAHVEEASRRRGDDYTDLALLTDGLRAEREQGITIDVAYRYFATPHREFIIADTPGHLQYTRNMVTGASTADLAIVLVNAKKGVVEQTRRHTFIASLLRIPHVVFAINKMDLVDWDQATFDAIVADLRAFVRGLDGISDDALTFIPMSALRGDNVVERSASMPWYTGPAMLEHLESVAVDRGAVPAPEVPLRFPVQWVIRPQSAEYPDYRGYAGQIARGSIAVGDAIAVVPSGRRSRVKAIDTYDGPLTEAFAPMSVTVLLEDELDISRGDMIVHAGQDPNIGQELEAMVCWMSEQPLEARAKLALKHTTRWVRAIVTDLVHKVDVNTMEQQSVERLGLNGMGRVRLKTTGPLAFDSYGESRATGSFILVDEATHNTVGAGMLLPPK
ncbi:MAG: sulfate adenylyltransferase [Deltaproteobacteria bacterium]|nr:sulfate adenylyltransferase [Deltaproteobacteria bacterium]